ncbi:excisionase [Azospirillum formosense]|uniref:excisionase n=1 Tax=Azospirillum formosense TaxID=861533 RepID=UPI00338FFA29
MDKLMTLEEWAKAVYGEHPPAVGTLRRWARDALIYPAPQKHGRSYFVLESARYTDPATPIPKRAQPANTSTRLRLADRIRHG